MSIWTCNEQENNEIIFDFGGATHEESVTILLIHLLIRSQSSRKECIAYWNIKTKPFYSRSAKICLRSWVILPQSLHVLMDQVINLQDTTRSPKSILNYFGKETIVMNDSKNLCLQCVRLILVLATSIWVFFTSVVKWMLTKIN